MALPAPGDFSGSIGFRKKDGLHGLVGWRGDSMGNPQAKCWTWTRTNTLRESSLPGWSGYLNNGSCAFCGTNLLVVTGLYKAGGVPPFRVSEYLLTSQPYPLVKSFDFGDDTNRLPICVTTNSGGVVIFSYRQTGPDFTLDVAYRQAPGPTPTVIPSGWWSTRDPGQSPFVFGPLQNNVISIKYSASQQADGTIWLTCTADGAGKIYLARFRENGGVIELVDFQEDYFTNATHNGVPIDGDMAPGQEFPPIVSAADPSNGRVILMYPQNGADFRCGTGLENIALVACYPDKRRELLAKVLHWVDSKSGIAVPFPQASKVGYVVRDFDDQCAVHWQTGSVSGGVVSPDKPSTSQATQMAFSVNDGGIAYTDSTGLVVNTYQNLAKGGKNK